MPVTLAGSSQALDSSLNTIYSEFKLLRDDTGIFRKVSTKYTLPPNTGVSKNILNYGRVLAFALTDGVDMVQSQALADTNSAFTPAEIGVQVILPLSTLRRVADPDLLRRTGRIMSNAYDLKEDQDGGAQLVNFVPIVGSAGTVISPGYCAAAGAVLRIGNSTANPEPAPAPLYGVLHPNQMAMVAAKLVPLSASTAGGAIGAAGVLQGLPAPGRTDFGDKVLQQGPKAAGMLWDMEMYSDANIPLSGTDVSAGFFSKEGLIYVSEVEPVMEPDEADKSLRAIELNLWGSYVWGLYRSSNYGVEALFDATTPTS